MADPTRRTAGIEGGEITVLHVEDDPHFADLTTTFLERDAERLAVQTVHDAEAALDQLAATAVDCVVSDYDLPSRTGLDLLEAVRDQHPTLPFILFTGKGSEEVASDAISAGVSDYLQKGGGRDAFDLLAKRIENAVDRRRARTNYREVMEKVPDGVVVHRPEDGTFVDMNSAFCELFGYSRAEFFEAGFEAIHPDEGPYTLDAARERVRTAHEEGGQTFRWLGVRRDGERIWCEVNLRRVRLNGNPRLLAVVRNVDDRVAEEQALQYERDRLAALFASVPEPVVHVRIDDATPIVVRTNEAFTAVFGHAGDAARGRSLDELIVPERLREEAAEINDQTVDEDLIEAEVVRQAHDGERRFRFKAAPIVQDQDHVEWVGTYVDLSGRNGTEPGA